MCACMARYVKYMHMHGLGKMEWCLHAYIHTCMGYIHSNLKWPIELISKMDRSSGTWLTRNPGRTEI